ncbi:MAG: MFS transporter, partial [Salinisphaera sp.]|nr:MFS transporter [Salinisphaera sp.]
MRQVVISLAAMFASLTLLILGSSLLGTLLAVRLAQAGFSPLASGAVLVLHSVGFVLGTRLVTRLIRRVGQVRAFSAFAAIACAVALIHPLAINGWLWALLRAVLGFCYAGLIMVLESWISGRATHASRGALMGIYQIVYFSAAAGGQYLVGLASPHEFSVFSLVAILLVLSLVPLAVTRSEAPVMGSTNRL